MNWFKKSKVIKQNKFKPLCISRLDGTPGIEVPGEVVDSIRRMIIRAEKKGAFPACLSMVSALSGEGVTFLSHALAATISHDLTASVCVVYLNWYSPSVSIFGDAENPGIAAVLRGEAELDDVIIPTGLPRLSIIQAGDLPSESRPAVVRSQVLKDVIQDLRQRFDYVILDVPAILETTDSISMAALSDACCMVVRHGVTTMEDVRIALDEIANLQIIGVILNRVTIKTPRKLASLIYSR